MGKELGRRVQGGPPGPLIDQVLVQGRQGATEGCYAGKEYNAFS